MNAEFAKVLEKLRAGDEDEALAELIGMTEDILSAIVQAYRDEPLPDTRTLLVKVAWERREPAAIDFLADALNDSDESVWQEALDGCVALASPEVIDLLQTTRTRERADETTNKRFQMCVDEALLYVSSLIPRR